MTIFVLFVTMIHPFIHLSIHPFIHYRPNRGKLLDNFFALDMKSRAMLLRDARRGGSIPPEILKTLRQKEESNPSRLECREEVQIDSVEWIGGIGRVGGEFHVTFDDGSGGEYDMIWLATGSRNHVDRYPALDVLRETLPIETINGLPVLAPDLSWSSQNDNEDQNKNVVVDETGEEINGIDELEPEPEPEPKWKQIARKRIWCMGALSALQLGPDALNIIGARHGAVKVASAIRADMNQTKVENNNRN